ncbi:hypothetical protein ACP70R_029245 [Stipagrostis hirtigluma subsp. patula]
MPCINTDEEEFEVEGHDQITKESKWMAEKISEWISEILIRRRFGALRASSLLEIVIPSYEDNGPFMLSHMGSNLCRLTRLSLFIVMLETHFAEVLNSGCHALVELKLTHCFNYLEDIKSATVKKLVCFNIYHGLQPAIKMPSLASLELTIDGGFHQNGISVCNAGSLVKASVCIQYGESFCAKNRRKLLSGLHNVMSLELNNFKTLAMLNKHSDNFPMFPNMRVLSLKECFLDDECDLHSKLADLGSFLENAPCLEKLTLWCCMVCSGLDSDVERKSISLQSQDGEILQCPKLDLIEVM